MTGMVLLLVCALGADDSGWRSTHGTGVVPASAQSLWGTSPDELVERAERTVRDSVSDALQGAREALPSSAGNGSSRWSEEGADLLWQRTPSPAGSRPNSDGNNYRTTQNNSRFGTANSGVGAAGVGRFGWSDIESALSQPPGQAGGAASRAENGLTDRLRVVDQESPPPLPPSGSVAGRNPSGSRAASTATPRAVTSRTTRPETRSDSARTPTSPVNSRTADLSRNDRVETYPAQSYAADTPPATDRNRFRDWLNETDTLPLDADDLPIIPDALSDRDAWADSVATDPRVGNSRRGDQQTPRTNGRWSETESVSEPPTRRSTRPAASADDDDLRRGDDLADEDFATRTARLRRETMARMADEEQPRETRVAARRDSWDGGGTSDRRSRWDDLADDRLAAASDPPTRDYLRPPARDEDWYADEEPSAVDRTSASDRARRPASAASREDDLDTANEVSSSTTTRRRAANDSDPAETSVTSELRNRPWWPLMMAVLGLFGSIGFNVYLGWIAWDLYTRYQDAVADVQELEGRLEERQLDQVAGLSGRRSGGARSTYPDSVTSGSR